MAKILQYVLCFHFFGSMVVFLQEQQWIQSNNLSFVAAAEVSIGSVQDVQRPVCLPTNHGVVR